MVTVTGAIFSLMNPAQGNAQTQPEVADMQQRMRVGNDMLFKEVMMAGAGPYQGNITGSLIKYFAPIIPRRVGDIAPDPAVGAGSFTTDRLTLQYIPNTYSQTTISQAMPPQSAELKVTPQINCPADANNLCGFTQGMEVIIFDDSGNYDTFTITNVQDAAVHVQHRGTDLNYKYSAGASITQLVSYTYYLDRTTNQLKRYDGHAKEEAIVDNVVDLRFTYFGDPNPPMAPKPKLGVDNCLYDAAGNYSDSAGVVRHRRFTRGTDRGAADRRPDVRYRRQPVRRGSPAHPEDPGHDARPGRDGQPARHGYHTVQESWNRQGRRTLRAGLPAVLRYFAP